MEPAEPREDPVIEEIVEASLAPYRGLVTPETLEDMRDVLILFLTTHPDASAAVDSLRARPVMASSGDVATPSAQPAAPVRASVQRRSR